MSVFVALLQVTIAAPPPAAEGPQRVCLGLRSPDVVVACRVALQDTELAPARRSLLLRSLALRLAAEERWSEVAATYSELVRLAPDDAAAHRGLGSVLLHGLGRPAEALDALRASLVLEPTSADGYGLAALCLNALGRPAEALRAFEDALRLDAGYLAARPAARRAFDAASDGAAWPLPAEAPRD